MVVPLTREKDVHIRTAGSRLFGQSAGFTLLELVLATMISALVMGILATALSFSLRLWERQMNRKTSDMPALLELMKWQLANFDPVPIATGDGNEARPLFLGDAHSLTFATDRSVKALSKGAPIIARYVFSQADKKLYYAERPLDPYHPDDLKAFLELAPGDEKTWPRFLPTDVESFAIGYAGSEEKSERVDSMEPCGRKRELHSGDGPQLPVRSK
jgi:type II secretory pathway pseudopilin PulG